MNSEDEVHLVLADASSYCQAQIGSHPVHFMACMLPSSGSGGDKDPCPVVSHFGNKVIHMVCPLHVWVIMAKTSASATKPHCFCQPFLTHETIP